MTQKQDVYLDVQYDYVPEYQLEAARRKRR